MEAPSELLCFWRHFCKLNPTFVILECWSVFITSCFGKGHILNLPCFKCFFPWPEGPGRSTAGAECSCVYNVCIMGPLVAKTVWFEVCLRHCSCGCGLKKPRQKILRVLLGMESYLNVMLWILRDLKSCVCHSLEGILRNEGGESRVMAWVGLESHLGVTSSTVLSLRLAQDGFSVVPVPRSAFAGQGQGLWDRLQLRGAVAGSILQESICRKACWAQAARYHLCLSRSRARVSVPCRQGIWLRLFFSV